jgi:hypothetical protein
VNSPTDKPTLREQLDAVRPDSDDLRDAELHEAARAVKASDLWQQTLARQEAFDRQVATAMQAVEVPDGLQARLMAALAATGPQQGEDFDVADMAERPEKPPTRRQTMLQVVALAAGLMLAATTGWLLLPRDGDQLTLEQTRQLIPVTDNAIDATTIAKLPAFDGRSFAFELPDSAWERTSLMVSPLKGLDWTGDDRHDGAIYEFSVGRGIHGYLLVLPATRITEPPNSTRMSATNIGYRPVLNTAWVNPTTKLAYICYVDQGDLQTLQRLLYPHAA